MNYQSIWKGDEYAWSPERPKGVFPRNGRKVLVLGKHKITHPGNTRQSAEVHVQYEGQVYNYITKEYEPKTMDTWVPAREIVDFWDNYSSELEHVQEEARLQSERYEAEKTERIRLREERLAAEAAEKERKYTDFAARTGIPREAISLLSDISVTITIPALERRLGIDW